MLWHGMHAHTYIYTYSYINTYCKGMLARGATIPPGRSGTSGGYLFSRQVFFQRFPVKLCGDGSGMMGTSFEDIGYEWI